jgi:quinol monooxygenase YgiN
MNMELGCLAEFEQNVAAMIDNVRAEDGCHFYALLVKDVATGPVNVIKQWRDYTARGVHFTVPEIPTFIARYSPKMLPSTVQIFDVAVAPRPSPG